MILTIPTRGRVARQVTLRALPADLLPYVHLWAPQDELGELRTLYPLLPIANLHAAPLGIAASRAAQIEWASGRGYEWLFFMDDDLWISARRGYHVHRLAPEEYYGLLDRIWAFAGRSFEGRAIVLVSLAMRRRIDERRVALTETYSNARAFGAWAVHIPTVIKEGLRIDSLGPEFVMDDFHLQLSLLERGYASAVIRDYVHDSKSNARGGASLYRTPEFHRQCAETLAREHPAARVIDKGERYAGKFNRWDVRVDWKRFRNGSSQS